MKKMMNPKAAWVDVAGAVLRTLHYKAVNYNL
jgi:hypothetical protein